MSPLQMDIGAAPDENMGGMPPPRGAADAAGVAAGKPPPREDVASTNEVGATPDENWEEWPPHAELLTSPVSRRENPRRVKMSPLPTDGA